MYAYRTSHILRQVGPNQKRSNDEVSSSCPLGTAEQPIPRHDDVQQHAVKLRSDCRCWITCARSCTFHPELSQHPKRTDLAGQPRCRQRRNRQPERKSGKHVQPNDGANANDDPDEWLTVVLRSHCRYTTCLFDFSALRPFGHQPSCGMSWKMAQSRAARSAPVWAPEIIFCTMRARSKRSAPTPCSRLTRPAPLGTAPSLRSLAGCSHGTELRTQRNPRSLTPSEPMATSERLAVRVVKAKPYQLPPRNTRREPEETPRGSLDGELA